MEEVIPMLARESRPSTTPYREMMGCIAFSPMVWVDRKNTIQQTTKTESGNRTIPLNSIAMEAVQRLKTQAIPGCPFVFATQTREHVSYRHLLATLEKACEAAGVEHRGLHALRHSFAFNLYARGVEIKVISKLLRT